MGAAQYLDVPGYSALILRRTYSDLALPDAIMDRSHQWWRGTGAHWNDTLKVWTFPTGAKSDPATVTFGFLQTEADKYRYQSAQFQYIGFDELTQFSESQYLYLFSRLRRLYGHDVPLRMRSASNPGGIGHDWVKQRFLIEGKLRGRVFLPASLDDNPFLDKEGYKQSLMNLDPLTRAQLLNGDWSARSQGSKFRREWFAILDGLPIFEEKRTVRYWDLAATPEKEGEDPDWTCGVKASLIDGVIYIEDVRRIRGTSQQAESLIKQTALEDGLDVEVCMEQEPGATGLMVIDHYARGPLLGYTFRGKRTTGNKQIRAIPMSSAAELGNVRLLARPWVGDLLDELEAFPNGRHDDQVDAASGAFAALTGDKVYGVHYKIS